MPTALFLHHDANSTNGWLGESFTAEGFDIVDHFICTIEGSPTPNGPMPSLDGVDVLVLMGSRWSVYDHDTIGAWIGDELDLVAEADRAAIPTLGVCFGAQVLAAALGGAVHLGPRPEIGWITVDVDESATGSSLIEVGPWFQWHLDVVTPPPDAELLATSPVGPQAFRLRRNLAVQFHPEVNVDVLQAWLVSDSDQLVDCGIDPTGLIEQTALNERAAQARARGLTRRFLESTRP